MATLSTKTTSSSTPPSGAPRTTTGITGTTQLSSKGFVCSDADIYAGSVTITGRRSVHIGVFDSARLGLKSDVRSWATNPDDYTAAWRLQPARTAESFPFASCFGPKVEKGSHEGSSKVVQPPSPTREGQGG